MNLEWIRKATGARRVERIARIQSLWGGHGELFRIALDDTTAIVKWARPPSTTDVSTTRKRRSYEVEAAFYRTVAPRCDHTCRVPALLASDREGDEWILVLEDLDAAGFGARVDEARGPALDAALRWLASFHARFVGERFDALWPVGTYWHLDTRRDELANITNPALRAAAPELAQRLAAAKYQTLVHGDHKEANFCFTRDHRDVAAVDFQYTGRACGMVDVAYLFHGRTDDDAAHLDTYFRYLGASAELEAEWRALYPVARRDFERFLAGWR